MSSNSIAASVAARRRTAPSAVTAASSSSNGSNGGGSSTKCHLLHTVAPELQFHVLTYLRATDLSAIQRTCTTYNDHDLIRRVIQHFANVVYPPDLTRGYDTAAVGGHVNATDAPRPTYEALRNMEMLVVVRVLSRPEPVLTPSLLRGAKGRNSDSSGAAIGIVEATTSVGGVGQGLCCGGNSEGGEGGNGVYVVSRSWCKAALKWLEAEQEKNRQAAAAAAAAASPSPQHGSGRKKKKAGKKQSRRERIQTRKMSDASPPWPDVNADISCPHRNLLRHGTKSARARRRLMDRQAWRVLRKLYPDSTQLEAVKGECLQCAAEAETERKTVADAKEKEKAERRRPLSDPIVRGIYTRSKGVPMHRLVQQPQQTTTSPVQEGSSSSSIIATTTPIKGLCGDASTGQQHHHGACRCPLQPGTYHALPRAWCHRWRKYLKHGDGMRPCAPDSSALLCDAHKLPLIPPHLEAFLYGETPALLSFGGGGNGNAGEDAMPGTPLGGAAAAAGAPSTPVAAAVASSAASSSAAALATPPPYVPVGYHPTLERDDDDHGNGAAEDDHHHREQAAADALRAAGLSETEVQLQRLAMLRLERQNSSFLSRSSSSLGGGGSGHPSGGGAPSTPASSSSSSSVVAAVTNEQLDRENDVVVEILTDEEFTALESWWPEIHSSYALRFDIVKDPTTKEEKEGGVSISWNTMPCRECDATGRGSDIVVRNRAQRWNKKRVPRADRKAS